MPDTKPVDTTRPAPSRLRRILAKHLKFWRVFVFLALVVLFVYWRESRLTLAALLAKLGEVTIDVFADRIAPGGGANG